MTEEEWYEVGDWKMKRYIQNAEDLECTVPDSERETFKYVWMLAGREMGIVK